MKLNKISMNITIKKVVIKNEIDVVKCLRDYFEIECKKFVAIREAK